MENIKFISWCMEKSVHSDDFTIAGNYLVAPMNNGNVAKLCCESNGVRAEILNKKEGTVDRTLFPFANYFSMKRCSPGAPLWHQHIENGKWYFSQYSHCLPTPDDYKRIADAVDAYLDIMDG